jgi:hypothetical protein
VILKDAYSGAAIRTISFGGIGFKANSAVVIPDLNGNGKSEIGVLGTDAVGAVKVFVKDAYTGLGIRTITYETAGLTAYSAVVVADLNGNGKSEIGVLGTDTATGTVRVILADAKSGAKIGTVNCGGTSFKALTAAAMPDLNGDGKSEIAVLGIESATGVLKVMVMNPVNGTTLKTITYGTAGYRVKPWGLLVMPDLNGNGKSEAAVVEVDSATGITKVLIKDASSGTLIKSIPFGDADGTPYGAAIIPDLNGNGPPEIALLLDYGSPKGIEAEIRDSLTGAFIKSISVP